jgi:ribose-phosphate pyrophosphokinase
VKRALIINLSDASRGDLACSFSTFPDGQPHLTLDFETLRKSAPEASSVELLTRIRSERDLVRACLAVETIASALAELSSSAALNLNLGYLLGARMDRRIAYGQPATLHVFVAMLNACSSLTRSVRVLDAHSPVSLEQLERSEALHPDLFVQEAIGACGAAHGSPPIIVIPDKGATLRTTAILERLGLKADVAACSKKRDPNTGKLSGFALETGDVAGRHCLIVDDICDGGGTFSGIADVLRAHGAANVSLAVTHGIFSKGLVVAGIDCIYATDSYGVPEANAFEAQTVTPGIVHYREAGTGAVRLQLWTDYLERVVKNLG